jgi:hypothetical protein
MKYVAYGILFAICLYLAKYIGSWLIQLVKEVLL